MKTMLRLLLAAALAQGAAHAAAAEMYVRGAFNGWGTTNVLACDGDGICTADILIGPGHHGFKVANRDWTAEWTIDRSTGVTVAPGTAYKLDTGAGAESYLFARQAGTWRFTVDVSDPQAPRLRVTPIDTVTPGPAIDPHAGHALAASLVFPTWDGKHETARFSIEDTHATLRSYTQSTSMQLRDPGPQYVRYRESEALPFVRTGNIAFDALFALAGAEMQQNAVREIRDGNYNGGAPIACACFATGEKWHYVWTRDLSYAADLGLAMLDPQRVRDSLVFKLSGYRPGIAKAAQVAGSRDGLQVVQDTGSGGSWPVSTDRVAWAFAAEEVLKVLPPRERTAFARRALEALSNTIDNDRLAAFDRDTGLYTGEQSFLDWRDQSYASWIPDDLSSMATSKALSTNAAHYKALHLAARLAREHGDAARAKRYARWARELKAAINARLWLDDAGMYSSLTAAHFDGAPMYRFDWLGQALAIVTGVASPGRARRILANYPHGPMGAPVTWPQQKGTPVYHNRAIWPFVTGYGLKAAALAGNVSVADAAYDSLMRGAALNLSNMENLEWLSGQPLLLDERNPSLSGPVINSRRQLWSVGAYLGMVIEHVFGVSVTDEGVMPTPFVTTRLRRTALGASDEAILHNLRLRGKRIDIRLQLPAASQEDGYHRVERVSLNGVDVNGVIPWSSLRNENTIRITLGALAPGQQAIRRVNADPYTENSAVFGPREPVIASLTRDAAGSVKLAIAPGGNDSDVVYNIYRDGKLAAARLNALAWTDRKAGTGACYAVEAQYAGSANRSHHSAPRCADRGIEIPLMRQGWGKPGDSLLVDGVRVDEAGHYAVQVRYHNGANHINLGVSAGVKWLAVKDQSGRTVAQGVVQLPHSKAPAAYSTPLLARLGPGSYRLHLTDFYNMSYLEANSTFSAAGGAAGPMNSFDIYGVRLLRKTGDRPRFAKNRGQTTISTKIRAKPLNFKPNLEE